jgi:hypothetical protein
LQVKGQRQALRNNEVFVKGGMRCPLWHEQLTLVEERMHFLRLPYDNSS